MVSEKEIEAAIKAIEAVPIMDDTYSLSGEDAKAAARAALEAVARVRAEANNECGEATHPAPGEPYRETAFAGVPGGVVRLLQGGDCLSAYGAVQEVAGQ